MSSENIVTLEDSERIRFAAYLEQNAASCQLIVKQMENIAIPAELKNMQRAEIFASLLIAKKLRNIESFTV